MTNNKVANKIVTEDHKKFARYAKAMGHPIRLFILETLLNQSCCYSGDLSDTLPIAKSTLSQHLKELRNAGLIQGEIEAPKVKYCINRVKLEEARSLFKNVIGN